MEGGWSSKKERAERGLRMAFMPKAINMVPNTLAAIRREGDWERREEGGAMFGFFCLCRCIYRKCSKSLEVFLFAHPLSLLLRIF